MRGAPLLVDVDSTTPTALKIPRKNNRRSVRRSKTSLDGVNALKGLTKAGGGTGDDKENTAPPILGEVNLKLLVLDNHHHDDDPKKPRRADGSPKPPHEEKEEKPTETAPSDNNSPKQQQQQQKSATKTQQKQQQQRRQDHSPKRTRRGGKRNKMRKSKTFDAASTTTTSPPSPTSSSGGGGGNGNPNQPSNQQGQQQQHSFLQYRQQQQQQQQQQPLQHPTHPASSASYAKPKLSKTQKQSYVAMDCEMVGIGKDGKFSSLARVTLVNWWGDVVMDEYILQDYEVTDYRTFVSGITKEILEEKARLSFAKARQQVWQYLQQPGGNPKILVGHALQNDLGVLGITHPTDLVRDTAKYEPYMKQIPLRGPSYDGSSGPDSPGGSGGGFLGPRSLKDLSEQFLERAIQTYGKPHSPYEDALAALDLYKHVRCVWEDGLEQKRLAEQQHSLWMQHQMHLAHQQQHFRSMGIQTQMRPDGTMMVVQSPTQQANSGGTAGSPPGLPSWPQSAPARVGGAPGGMGHFNFNNNFQNPNQQQYPQQQQYPAANNGKPNSGGRRFRNNNKNHRSISPKRVTGGGMHHHHHHPPGGTAATSFSPPRRRATMGH